MATVRLFALAVALGGCERGCLTTWLDERGLGSRPGPRPSRSGQPPAIDLSGIDCSDGLLRCTGSDSEGWVEASRATHLPHPCGGGTQGEGRACECPWDRVLRCSTGCAEEGLEIVGPADGGAAQLCRPESPVARPIVSDDAVLMDVCADEGVRCAEGVVGVCDRRGQPMRAIAKCLYGCETRIAVEAANTDISQRSRTFDPGAATNPSGVISILCRRDHAERR